MKTVVKQIQALRDEEKTSLCLEIDRVKMHFFPAGILFILFGHVIDRNSNFLAMNQYTL